MVAALSIVPSDDNDKLAQEMLRRFSRAELDFNRHITRIADCYKFAMPWRHKINVTQPTDQLDDIFDESLMTIVEDFAADMLNTFTPMKNDWVEIKPASTLRDADQAEIKRQLQDYQGVLFAEMARSNLYQALQEAYLDLAIGTMALTIQDIDPAEPLHCQAIPMTELRIDRGPWSGVDGKWRKWSVRGEDISTLWPGARMPDNGTRFESGDMTNFSVIDGSWRVWTDRSKEVHRYAVMANSKIIYQERYEGAGSCPMIVARWSRDSTTALGVGPTYRTSPAFKTLNHIKYLLLKNLDKQVDPVVSYENDGVINVEHGVEPGTWIPREVGSHAPEPVESKNKFDVAWVQADDLMSIIKRAHYQDRPEQTGKTPPSATQWADEAAERARRMGTPATSLVHELQYPIIRRFAYLLTKRGILPPVKLNGKEVALTPISPLLRAQEQEEIVRMDRFAEMLGARLGPQFVPVLIDIIPWAKRLADRYGIDGKLLRDAAKMKTAIEQLMPILQNFSAGHPNPLAPPPVGTLGGP